MIFDESKHPRDKDGKFTDGGGKVSEKEMIHALREAGKELPLDRYGALDTLRLRAMYGAIEKEPNENTSNSSNNYDSDNVRPRYDIEKISAKLEEVRNAKGQAAAEELFRSMLENGEINETLHKGNQDKHIEGTNNYKQERAAGRNPSILTADPVKLFESYSRHGELDFNIKDKWTKKAYIYEVAASSDIIGVYINNFSKISEPTRVFSIHYSNKGYHIVPENPRWEKMNGQKDKLIPDRGEASKSR